MSIEMPIVLAFFTLASIFGTVAASFYGVRQKTIIETLQASNNAYVERNSQLVALTKEQAVRISQLEGRVTTLENIKTPPLEPLIQLITSNHIEIMTALNNI